jgi:hypothetical protein
LSKIFLKDEDPQWFLMDSKGDLYQVSEEIAKRNSDIHPHGTAVVDHVDTKTNTIWFSNPLPKEVKAE